jgi:solute carrier family 32 (vesicular inhibitory amino acid transporter)
MDEVTLNLPAGVASTIALALITVNPFSKFALTMDPVRLLPTTPFAW